MLAGQKLKEHVLNRLGYGPGRWHSERYDTLGHQDFVDEQLGELLPEIDFEGTTIGAKIYRSALSRRQLEAVLIDFWFNHFNVNTKSVDPEAIESTLAGRKIGHHQNRAIAPFVLGQFGDMLDATAKSPSMLDYLDNRLNAVDAVIDGVQFGPNENYARELLELHTVGADGGFTPQDISDAARALTGWTIRTDEFVFYKRRHDTGPKQVLGHTFPGGGLIEEGEELLAMLAAHPSTARHLCAKLVERFINESRPSGALDRAVVAYEESNGDLRQVMTAIAASGAFLSEANFRSKIKPPHRFVASALLAMGARERDDISHVRWRLEKLIIEAGEVPYVVGPPTGYPDRSAFWVSGPSMIARFKIAQLIAYDSVLRRRLWIRIGDETSDVAETLTKVTEVMVPGGLSANSRRAILDHIAANTMSDNARLSAAAHLVLCSPEFVRY